MTVKYCPICSQEIGRHDDRYCETLKIVLSEPAKAPMKYCALLIALICCQGCCISPYRAGCSYARWNDSQRMTALVAREARLEREHYRVPRFVKR